MGRNVGYIYGLLMGASINTNGMSPEEAYITWNELQNKVKTATPAEKAKLKREYGIDLDKIEQKSNLTNEEKRLQELTGEKVEHEPTDEEKKEKERQREEYEKKRQENWEKLWNKLTSNQKGKVNRLLKEEPVQIKADNKVLNVIFTEDTVGKSLSERFNFDKCGLHWKIENVDKFPDILKCLEFDDDKAEEGKGVGIHRLAKRWYYFVGEYSDGKNTFEVNADIVDTGEQQILYLLKMKKKGT